jgi:hypothetical protein
MQECAHIEIRQASCRGIVSEVSEGGTKDAVIRLTGDNTSYYINRGLETRFSLTGLQKDIVGKQVIISYAKHWSLSPAISQHIGQLQAGRDVIYSEFK